MGKNKNLVFNAEFDGRRDVRDWSLFAPRPVLAPQHQWNKGSSLVVKATGDNRIFGGWRGKVQLQSQTWYKATVRVHTKDIAEPDLSVLAMVGNHILLPKGQWQEEMVLEREFKKGESPFENNYVDLFIRSADCGQIEWSRPSVVEIEQPRHRMAKIATVRFGPPDKKVTLEYQRKRIQKKLEEAGTMKPDAVLLTEFSSICGMRYEDIKSYTDYAEIVPDGPTCKLFAAAARKYRMYVIGGVAEKRGNYFYNTAIIFDRKGNFVGQYDKTHLTMVELLDGFSCGQQYPVFDLDFGRIGIHICYDEWFPEVSRFYAYKGVEILFLPVMGGKPMTWRTRALDNGIYFVSSSENPPSMIIDSSGAIIAETHGDGVACANLNLDYRKTNAYIDPTLSYGMPTAFPQLRHVTDDTLLDELFRCMRGGSRDAF